MSKENLYINIPGINNVLSVTISESHSSPTALATIMCEDENVNIGDLLTINLGYLDNYSQIFKGYVRQKECKFPNGLYTITLHDYMCRAIDFFIASDDPNKPFSRKNISAEDLVKDVFALAGLTNFTYEATSFTLAINVKAEVNLISVYDYCKSIADIVTWTLWADQTGKIHFENRKPYLMTGSSGQIGDTVNEYSLVPNITLTDADLLEVNKAKDEANLRNKVVVYGNKDAHATASSSTSYDPEDNTTKQILPSGFYKTVVIASSLIGNTTLCQKTADYNLNLLNRLTFGLNVTAIGNPNIHARDIIKINSSTAGINSNWYVYSVEHNWGSNGYTMNLGLRL